VSFSESISEIIKKNENGLLGLHQTWCRVLLRDVTRILNGYAFSSNKFSKNKGIPLLRIRDIIVQETDTYYNGEYNPIYLIHFGDFIVGMDGDFNCIIWKGKQALLNQRVCKIIPSECYLNKKFLSYVLPGYLNAINAATSSVTVKHLSSSTIAEIPLPLPPLTEQHRIVTKIEELFTKLDAGVEVLKKIKTQLKRYRHAILKYAFEGKLTEKWRKTHIQPTSPLVGGNKEEFENLPTLPERWRLANVGDISNRIHYGYTASAINDHKGPKMLRITDIQNSIVNWSVVPYCKIDQEEKRKYLLNEGDLVFARTGATVGKSYLISGNIPEAVFASYLIRIILSDQVERKYVYYFFQSHKYWSQIHRDQIGIGQPNVNSQKLAKILLPLPPNVEQHQIVTEIEKRYSVADKIEKIVDASLIQSERLRKSILKRAFEGKLVPQDPNDEPADKLFERIIIEKINLENTIQKTRGRGRT
jgi:type I restriction enzyme S subunit